MAGTTRDERSGMTQVFDAEDGHVERVTVIEAGPCFVTAIRRAERDGYDAVQLALRRGPREEALTKARARPPARRPACRNLRHLARVPRRRRASSRWATSVTVDVRVREGPDREGLRRLEGQGLRGHDQAPQLPAAARSRTARTTCARRARSAPPPTPRACSRASAAPARWATSASTQRGLEVVDVRTDKNLLLVRGSVPGPQRHRRRDQERRLMAAEAPRSSAEAPAS